MAKINDTMLCKVVFLCAAATLYGVKADCDAKARELRKDGVKCKVQTLSMNEFNIL